MLGCNPIARRPHRSQSADVTDRLLGSDLTRRSGRSSATGTEAALDTAATGRDERQGGAGHRRATQPVDDLHLLAGGLGDVRLGRIHELVTSPEEETHQPKGMTGEGQPRKQLDTHLMTHVIAPARGDIASPSLDTCPGKKLFQSLFSTHVILATIIQYSTFLCVRQGTYTLFHIIFASYSPIFFDKKFFSPLVQIKKPQYTMNHGQYHY